MKREETSTCELIYPLHIFSSVRLLSTYMHSNFNGVDTALLALPVTRAVSAQTSTGNDVREILPLSSSVLVN